MLFNIPAPAKINRFLHVVGRRADGYHLLESVFELVSVCDLLDFSLRSDGKVVRHGDLATLPDDLCTRAALLLQSRTGCRYGADIVLHKKIPTGAGLGGGSSDAATTLIALTKLWNLPVLRDTLSDWSVTLGADVPFFIRGENAFVRGIGEDIPPICLPRQDFALIWPGVHTSTKQIFQSPDLTRNSQSLKIDNLLYWLETDPEFTFGRNDLESVVLQSVPAVRSAVAHLSTYGRPRMTGSGSSVFAAMEDQSAAEHAIRNLPHGWIGMAVSSLSKHPLYDWLDN